jgi:NADP-dependent 3-hydroxy acid dehydrogenase YdfG
VDVRGPALITGASSGIGAAVARRLARRGHPVVLVARRAERLEALAAELSADGARALARPLDVRDEAGARALVAELRAGLGGVEVLINAAGLGRRASLLDGTTEAWRELLEVNVLALSVWTREVIADLRAREARGHIVHISSMSAHRVTDASMYSATKFAVRALTEGLRRELRAIDSPIRVTSISPGFVDTEFHARLFGDADGGRLAYGELEPLTAEDVASAVEFALSQRPGAEIHDLLLRPTAQRL